MTIQYQFRPIAQAWPGQRTPKPQAARFRVTFQNTLDLLDRELRHLQGKHIVLQADVESFEIRHDGMLRSTARPRSQAIILSFHSKHGPLSYPCDRFNRWQDNLRAIALSLEALRCVDRYGVTRRAEQYRGWQQLPPPAAAPFATEPLFTDAVGAASFIVGLLHEQYGKSADDVSAETMLEDMSYCASVLRTAEKATHPDAGGSSKDFKNVQMARNILKIYYLGML